MLLERVAPDEVRRRHDRQLRSRRPGGGACRSSSPGSDAGSPSSACWAASPSREGLEGGRDASRVRGRGPSAGPPSSRPPRAPRRRHRRRCAPSRRRAAGLGERRRYRCGRSQRERQPGENDAGTVSEASDSHHPRARRPAFVTPTPRPRAPRCLSAWVGAPLPPHPPAVKRPRRPTFVTPAPRRRAPRCLSPAACPRRP